MTPDMLPSLIVRLADPRYGDAWSEFTTIYRPVVYWQAREQGLQDANAEDFVQQVLTSISNTQTQRRHNHATMNLGRFCAVSFGHFLQGKKFRTPFASQCLGRIC
ncbi:MAG: hypothetical protein KF851_06795 [Pirellulaceae bacterium]|nr:hypothetical protein [Pirellulaceae bacterium]